MADDRNTNSPVTDPDDEENVVIDTTSSEPLREATLEEGEQPEAVRDPNAGDTGRGEPPPRFGSGGIGRAEREPGPDGRPDRS